MKYLVILTDGMADESLEHLQGQTPLQAARTPHLDRLAASAYIGQVKTIPDGFSPGSDVANLSVMGYDPRLYYTGRSPLEAVSMGVELADNDLALRCNLVTLSGEHPYPAQTMVDYSAGEIETSDGRALMDTVSRELGLEAFQFHGGISYRHLLVWKDGRGRDLCLTPPHDISGQKIASFLPAGRDGHLLLDLMIKSQDILADHPVNIRRKSEGHPPVSSIWLWGEGVRPALPTFQEKYGLSGAVVAAVDLVKGLGICAGLDPIRVEGATGAIATNFAGKTEAALKALKTGYDYVYLHIESPDEAGHQGSVDRKIWSIEQIDQQVIGMVWDELQAFDDICILVMPDHPTPIRTRTHSREPVPYLLYDSRDPNSQGWDRFDESTARRGLFINEGHLLMDYLLRK